MSFKGRNLNRSKLPLNRDVMEYLLFLRTDALANGGSVRISYDSFRLQVSSEISGLWHVKGIPIIRSQRVSEKIKAVIKGYKEVSKRPDRINETYWNELFNIAKCKCEIELENPCTCEEDAKIPSSVKKFYIDQCKEKLLSL